MANQNIKNEAIPPVRKNENNKIRKLFHFLLWKASKIKKVRSVDISSPIIPKDLEISDVPEELSKDSNRFG